MRFTKLLAGLLLMMGATRSYAQEFSIKKVEITQESVILHYDLIDTIKARNYTIHVYSSKDSYLAPLQKLKGDVGLEVRPGQNKKIIWNSREELGSSFQGDIELEIRGRLYIPFISFEGFQDGQVIKRGKPTTITWSGGTRQNILNFTLYKEDTENEDKYIYVLPNVSNSGSHDLVIPTSVKPGKGYYFLVSDSKNKDQVMKTNSFSVKPKIPLVVKLLPFVVIGAAIPFLLPEKGPSDLDVPVDPPGDINN